MNLRKQNGFSGVDMAITVVIIMIFIPTTFGIVYNLGQYKSRLNRLATSVNLAVGIIEETKCMAYTAVDMDDIENYIGKKYLNSGINDNSGTIEKDGVTYKIEVSYENPSQYDESKIETHIVKKVNVKITYPIGNNTKSIELSRILKRENL